MAALQYKDDHNKIAYLGRERGCEDFTDILSYLDHSPLRYALTHAPPVVFDSLVKQFWATAVVRPNAAGSHDLVALLTAWVVVTEFSLGLRSANTFDTPMLAIAAVGDDAAAEENVAAHEAAGSTVGGAPPEPYSPRFPLDTWPSVPAHSPVRDPTPEPASPPSPPAQTFIQTHGYVDPDFVEPIIFGPQPRPDNYLEPEDLDNLLSMEDDTTHGGFHVESPVRPNDASTPTADAAGRAEDPVLLTSLSAKLDRCMGRLDSLETELGTTKKIMGGAILTLVSRVKKLEKTVKQLRTTRLVGDVPAAEGDVDIQDDVDLDGLSRLASAALGHDQPAVPSADVEEREEEEVPLRRKRSAYRRARTEFSTPAFEQFQANLSAGGLPHTAVSEFAGPSIVADKGKAPMPDLGIPAEFLAEDAQARKRFRKLNKLLLGADVTEENFIEPMTAVKEWKKRALADLRYQALKGKPLRNLRSHSDSQLVKIHGVQSYGTITMEESSYEYKNKHLGAPVTDPTVSTSAAMDSAGSHREIGVSPFADSAASSSPSNVSTDHIPIDVLFASTSGGIHDFFLESDEEEQIGLSRVAADPDSDDEVLAEIIFRGKSISGDGVVLVDRLPDDEIVDPRVKVETVSDYASSPPRNRRKHLGVRSDDCLWDKPVEDFFSSESESDDDMENYIPPLPYGEFKDWEMVSCPPGNSYIHVYYQQNRRRKYFTYLKQLLPYVYREDLLLLRRRMNRYFRLNPDVDVGLDLWRDVNLLCQSLHSDDVEDFWRTQDDWIVSSWKLYPKSSVHVLDLTNGKTVYMFVDKVYPIRATLLERMLRHRLTVPPSYCRDVVVAGNVIQTVQAGLRESYECLASVPIACTARQMVFSSPWLTAKKESGSSLQTALVCNSNPLIALASPEQTATGKDVSNPLYGCDGLPKTVRVFQFTLDSRSEKLDWLLLHQDWKLLFFDVAASFDSAVHRVHAVSFDAAVASTVSAACCSSSVPADYVPAGHVIISADRYSEYADLSYRQVIPDVAANSRPIFDDVPLQKVHTNDDNYNVFANERQHLEQPESINDTYAMEKDNKNTSPDSSNMCSDEGEAD
ncbi:hypothetical protein Tco_1185306 [Tanacetum coccineum]